MASTSISNPVCLWLSKDSPWETASCYLTWNRFDPFSRAYLSFSDRQFSKEICQQSGDYAFLLITKRPNLPDISMVQRCSVPSRSPFPFRCLFWSSFILIVLVQSDVLTINVMLCRVTWLLCANEKWFSKKKPERGLISQPCSTDVERIDSRFNLIFSSKSEHKQLAGFTLLRDKPSIKASWRWIFG